MSAKMKRRQRHDRLKRIRTERAENALFFSRGTIPASAHAVSTCWCGAAMFTRASDDHDALADFHYEHSLCNAGVAR